MPFRYQKLQIKLEQQIKSGRWQAGERLPSIRSWCQELGLSKATVIHALDRLEAKGYIIARPKSGYFVSVPPETLAVPETRAVIEKPQPVTVSEVLQDIMQRSAAFDILPQMHCGEVPAGIATLNRSIGRALRRQKGDDFQYYDDPAGDIKLREELARLYWRRGAQLSAQQFCITSGCQHALFLALMATCKKGDIVAVESPGFYGVLQLLEQLELQAIEVPASTSTGLDISMLEEVMASWNVSACIVSPSFATPGGALMADSARGQFLGLAQKFDVAVIEDDIYAESALMSVPDSLKSLDIDDRVIVCSSFSKTLSRDLRLGWIVGARWQTQILRLKLITQLASCRFLQLGVADFIADGSYASHLRRLRSDLRQRRDQLLAELGNWNFDVRASSPEGGLSVWVEMPETVDTLQSYSRALNQGIVLTPGPLFSVSGQYRHCMRLSYAHPWNRQRLEALRRPTANMGLALQHPETVFYTLQCVRVKLQGTRMLPAAMP